MSDPTSVPSISLLVPMYNVATYLPQFFASLEAQTADISDLEVVFVDDGSPDDSAALVEAWLAKQVVHGKLIRQANAGPAEARNRGLPELTGEWVTFPDPDDLYSPNYFERARAFLASPAARDVHLVSANLLMLDDATGEITDTHPLRAKFAGGRQVVDLEEQPRFIHLQSASAFYRRAPIEDAKIRFDARVRPNFEDAHFTAYYLATFDRPRIAVLPDIEYRYRRRSDGSSLIQGSWAKPEKYTQLPEHGYLDVLRHLQALKGYVPSWAQTLILYDLAFYFRHDGRPNSATAGITAEQSRVFHGFLREILGHIDTARIEAFDLVEITDDMRMAMVIGGKGEQRFPRTAQVDFRDDDRGLVRVWYYYAGDAPAERWHADGVAIEPVFGKTRSVRFLGATMMYQRIAWLPSGRSLGLDLDGAPLPLLLGGLRGRRADIAAPARIRAAVSTTLPPGGPRPAPVRQPFRVPGLPAGSQLAGLRARVRPAVLARSNKLKAALLRAYARTPRIRTQFKDAWLLMDRDTQAQDNAERLYEYLRAEQPQVNAWFVIARTSPDWKRLQRKGFRLIPHGSRTHTLALLNCRHLVSSHIDHYVVHPLPRTRFPENWHYTFLQHGVTKDDLSVWINGKPIDLMLTVTPDEHAAIVGELTPYRYTEREIALTGFPRHDRLLDLAAHTPDAERQTLLVSPTWRRELLLDVLGLGNERGLREDFWQTDYAAQWRAFLESELLHKGLDELGWQLAFVPHPNMQDYLDDSPLPPHIAVHRYTDTDIQELLARTGVLVTDYSSMAFETAYLERPVVYFQFDRAEFFNGTHAYRRGTWSYEQSGFGPITEHADEAVHEVLSILGRGAAATDEYLQRMRSAFPWRDGQCSRRTYAAIRALETRLPDERLYRAVELP